jgi:hypothetical protein
MVVSKASHKDKPTTTYVYEYPDGTTAKFYIKDDYVTPPASATSRNVRTSPRSKGRSSFGNTASQN